jgi:hypothetical protein
MCVQQELASGWVLADGPSRCASHRIYLALAGLPPRLQHVEAVELMAAGTSLVSKTAHLPCCRCALCLAHHNKFSLFQTASRGHACLTFELLGDNLYEHLRACNFQGCSLPMIRRVAQQVLVTLRLLRR